MKKIVNNYHNYYSKNEKKNNLIFFEPKKRPACIYILYPLKKKLLKSTSRYSNTVYGRLELAPGPGLTRIRVKIGILVRVQNQLWTRILNPD